MAAFDQRGSDAARFGWLGSGRIPVNRDLRRCGWSFEAHSQPHVGCVCLLDLGEMDCPQRKQVLESYPAEMRRFILVIGMDRADERTALLLNGFGDAVDSGVDLDELNARTGRIAEHMRWLPRLRIYGELKLDLLAREAYRSDRPLSLNPREFTLLWRLADSPNQTVSKQALIHDVWRMGFVPVTNSIAVHMSRLRRKLGFAGLDGIIETVSSGGYCLRIPHTEEAELLLSQHETAGKPAPILRAVARVRA